MRHRGRPWAGAGAAVLLAAVLTAGCGPSGGIVSVDNNRFLTFSAAAGKANDVTVTRDSTAVVVHDAGDAVRAGNGCTAVDANTVRCPDPISVLSVKLGDGDDEAVNSTAIIVQALGGPGSDRLTGGSAGDILFGELGADTVDGGGGDDFMDEAQTTADTNSLDADTYIGGAGTDSVTYARSTTPVAVDLDGVADDGRTGEGDNVHADVEKVTGGPENDTLVGSASVNTIDGNGGVDVLKGGDGGDLLRGGAGGDFIDGQAGNDTLKGDSGFDLLAGGTGTDDCDVGLDGGSETACEV
jgi:Ca2+-binding RTX toxin-like protein